MIDHTGILVSAAEHDAVVAWYTAALAPLGYVKFISEPGAVGFSDNGTHADWWVISTAGRDDASASPHKPPVFHHAFVTDDHAAVDAFHGAAVAAGAKDNGPPGPRAHYGPSYYAAFVLDPVGNNIEAVCHKPPKGDLSD